MAALTKDVMLKIDPANIHAEMVSGNNTKPGDIPALKTPYREKLTRADIDTAQSKAETLCTN